MKIAVLTENTPIRADFRAEHGLSLWLESAHTRVLFDFGQTDALLHHARLLNLDLNDVHLAVLSHGHYDHGGGAKAFLQCNDHAPVYVHPLAFGDFRHGEKYIGLDDTLKHHPRTVLTGDAYPLNDTMTLLSCNRENRPFPDFGNGLTKVENGTEMPDDFLHEQYLLVQEGEKRILISGCSHKGILNIVSWLKPHVLIGGFHLSKVTDEETLQRIGTQLLQSGTAFYTGHCTGDGAYAFLKTMLKDQLHPLHAGDVLEV